MQTELPTMLNVLDTDYQLEYSESYTGTVGQETAIEGYQYCTLLQIAFESLLSQNYTNFILTVGCVCVSIYCNVDVGFKIFDSHARMYTAEPILRVYVCFSKHYHLIA